MAGTKNTALRNTLADAFGGVWDSGTLEIIDTDGSTVLATFNLAADAFAAASGGAIALSGTPISTTGAASGTAATANLKNAGGTQNITGLTVATSGAQVTIDNTSIAGGQTVNLTAFAWTESATTA